MMLTRYSWLMPLMPLLVAQSAIGQAAAWIDFDGAIKGSATDSRHRDWIDLTGFEISGTLATGQIGGFSIRKSLDRASGQMFLGCVQGTRFPKATLDMNRSAALQEPRLARLDLDDVWLTHYQCSGASGGEFADESVGLVFKRIIYTYVLPDSKTVSVEFDYFSSGGEDSDNDGMPDAWEATYGLSVGSDDSNGDLDGDGLTNLQEYQLGTDPKSGTSFFKASLSPATATPGTYQLTWNSVAGKAYVIEWSPDLKTPFATLRTVTATAASTTETITNTGNVGFYRVRPQ